MKQVKRRTNKQVLNAQTINAHEAESTCSFFDHVTRTKGGTVGSAAGDNKLSLTLTLQRKPVVAFVLLEQLEDGNDRFKRGKTKEL